MQEKGDELAGDGVLAIGAPPLLAGLLAGVLLFVLPLLWATPPAEGEEPTGAACQSGAGRGQSSAFNRARRGKGTATILSGYCWRMGP